MRDTRREYTEWLFRVNEKFNSKFDYSLASYQNYHKALKIKCPVHGEFSMTPIKHEESNKGCIECSKVNNDRRVNRSHKVVGTVEYFWIPSLKRKTRLYILISDCNTYTKVGISRYKADDRCKTINRVSGINFQTAYEKEYKSFSDARKYEKELLEYLALNYTPYDETKGKFGGYTEVYQNVDNIKLLQKIID